MRDGADSKQLHTAKAAGNGLLAGLVAVTAGPGTITPLGAAGSRVAHSNERSTVTYSGPAVTAADLSTRTRTHAPSGMATLPVASPVAVLSL